MLATVNLESVAPMGSALRAIDELVNQLDTSEIEMCYDLDTPQGAKPLYPKTMIKVALYALHNCRFSLRKMEADTQHHLGYRWLTGNETIDHSTMGKFLSRFKAELPELLCQVAMIGIEHELIDFEVLSIDTVKIRANASYKQFRTTEAIEKEKTKLKNRLADLIENSYREDEEEHKALQSRLEKLERAKEVLQKRIEEKSVGKTEREREDVEKKERINVTDHGCSLMQQANGEKNSAFAITVSSDSANDFIVHVEVQENPNDAEALMPAVEGSRETAGGRHDVVNADAGFASIENLERLEEDNQFALIPDRRHEAEVRGELSKGEYDRSKFTFEEQRDCYICPQGVELGRVAAVVVNGRIQHRYGNRSACKNCDHRSLCTKGSHRIVSRDSNEAIKERMRERLSREENKELYKLRAHSIESPFGQIKHNLKYRIFMRRGREKVKMEISLLCMLHNIMKIGRKAACAA
jgi:transposase